ncbi:MAG: Ig-like domain-containing protein [Spirochaetota bacterium]|nr:Ig-like domain-containing protein [Spirochaetota bacterium]
MGKKILLVLLLCLFSLLACSEPNEILEPNNDKTLSQEAMVPNIIKQPQLSNYYFVNNQLLELSINAEVTDNGTLTYQWYKNNELIKDAISSSYQEKLSVTENADVQYFCEVTNMLGITKKSVKSQVVTIHLIKDFYSQAVGYTLQIGKSQIIDVMTVGKVEWKSSDENIVKVENGEITAIAIGKATVTAIFKDFADMCKTWEIIVNDKVNAEIPKCDFLYDNQKITQDVSSFFVKGGKLQANAKTDDNGALSYIWFVDGDFAGVTTATCDVTKPGFYYCVVTNTIIGEDVGEATATVTSPVINIKVKKPDIVGLTYGDEEIKDNKAFAKSGAALKVAAEVCDEVEAFYQWYKDDEKIDGATGDFYVVNEYAVYHCVVSNVIASQEYKEETVSDKVKIVKNKVSFQEAVDRAESRSASALTFSNTSISYGEEQIDLGDEFGEYTFVTGDAVVNKSLSIFSSVGAKFFDSSKLSIKADDVTLSGLEIDTIEATAELGNGRLTIQNSKLNNLLLNGGGYNSIYMDGRNTIMNASFGKKDLNQYVRLKGMKNGSTEITNLNFLTSGMIQGNLNVNNVFAENWHEASINFAMDVQANVTVPEGVTEVYFGTMEGDIYEPKFKILLNKNVQLNNRFLNQAGNKLWGDDFYGYSWHDVDSEKEYEMAILTRSVISDLLKDDTKILKLSCAAKEKAIFLPHIMPTERFMFKNNNWITAVKQFHLTHYSKLYESLSNHEDTIDIDDPEEVELETLLLNPDTDDYVYPDLKGYENAFSVVHDNNRNVYATIACGNVTSITDLTRYGHFYIKMLREEDITDSLNGKESNISMEKIFELPDYLTDLSYLGDLSSAYAAVNAEVSYFMDVGNFCFNNNFVASFARLAVNGDGTKLYLLTGADGKDMTGETYKLCAYDLTSKSNRISPTEISVTWKSGVPQAMALSEDGTKLYVAEIAYSVDGYNRISVEDYNSYINTYTLNENSAVYSGCLFSYDSLPDTTNFGYTSLDSKLFFGKTRVGVSDMKTGNGCLYITAENVNRHVSVSPEVTRYSRGALTIVDLSTGEIKAGKEAIGWSESNIPTEAKEYSCFYGPTRILAVEPKKIIILDDGNIDDGEVLDFSLYMSGSAIWSEKFLKQKNRVAVYDLEKERLDFANMGSDFGLYSTRINGSF